MENNNELADLFEEHQNSWVALSDDGGFICSGSTLDEVYARASNLGCADPITMKIPDMKYEFILCLDIRI